ncbi:hypothetical protein TWF694_003406 [Orbilia ellipsospora]|uniref:GPI inositol-deacylase winged helix domain-containing protein n=1 Tax=Orbilia ellipsospora TaxID=2528407 RepID=A0AAV9WZF8_9PEZI
MLPRGLPETYDRILEKIKRFGDMDSAKKVFCWITAASTPLNLEELAEATAFELGDTSYNQGRFPIDNLKLVLNCGNLATIEQFNGESTVHFAHSTVLEHLRNGGLVIDQDAHIMASHVCIVYLSLCDFERQITTYSNPINPTLWEPKDLIAGVANSSIGKSSSLMTAALLNASKISNLQPSKDSIPIKATINIPKMTENVAEREDADFGKPDKHYKLYKFANYARRNWMDHSRYIEAKDPVENLFWNLIFERTLPFEHLPKSLGSEHQSMSESSSRSQQKVIIWAAEHDHLALLRILRSRLGQREWNFLLRCNAENGKEVVFDFVSDSCLVNQPPSTKGEGYESYTTLSGPAINGPDSSQALRLTFLGKIFEQEYSEDVFRFLLYSSPEYGFLAAFKYAHFNAVKILCEPQSRVDVQNFILTSVSGLSESSKGLNIIRLVFSDQHYFIFYGGPGDTNSKLWTLLISNQTWKEI